MSVTVIYPEEFKGEFKDLGELLDHTVGVHVTSLAGRGSYTVVSIRGSTASQVAVYVDGILYNLGGMGSVDLSNIPIEEVERIEVYRGSAPSFFEGAIGGVINIVTKKKGEGVSLGYTLGSFETYRLFGSLGFKKRFSFLTQLKYEESKGNYRYHNDNTTPFNKEDDYWARRKNNGYRERTALLSLGMGPVDAQFRYFRKMRELPGAAPGRDIGPFVSRSNLITERSDGSLTIKKSWKRINLMGQGYAFRERKLFRNPDLNLGPYGLYKSRYRTWKLGFRGAAAFRIINPVTLRLFSDIYRERLKTYSFTYKYTEGIFERDALELSGEIELNPIKGLTLTPRYRYKRLDDSVEKRPEGTFIGLWKAESRREDKSSLSVGLRYNIDLCKNLKISFKANLGKYFRYPTFYELFGDGATLVPNPSLKPEESTNRDIGIAFNFRKGFLRAGDFEVTYFHNDIRDLIEFIMVNERMSVYKNISRAEVKGWEFSGDLVLPRIYISFNHTIIDSKSKAKGYRKGEPLPNRPEYTTNIRGELSLGKVSLWCELHWIGKNYFDDGGLYYFNSYNTIDMGVNLHLGRYGKLSLVVKNLTDEQDMLVYSEGSTLGRTPYYPLVGKSIYLTYTLKAF